MSTTKEQPFCGFTIQPKYPINTKIRKHIPGKGTFKGCIVSFDGDRYDVLYDDGETEQLCEAQLGTPEVEILAKTTVVSRKRPTRHRNPVVAAQQNFTTTHEVPTCPICTEEFASDTASSRSACCLPIQAIHCAHVICKSCVGQIQAASQVRRKFLECPLCKTPKSFDATNPTVCLTMCEMVDLCRTVNRERREVEILEQVQSEKVTKPQARPQRVTSEHQKARAEQVQREKKAKEAVITKKPPPKRRKGVAFMDAVVPQNPHDVQQEEAPTGLGTDEQPQPYPAQSSEVHPESVPSNTLPPYQGEPVLLCAGCNLTRKKSKFSQKGQRHASVPYCRDCIRSCASCGMDKRKHKFSTHQWQQMAKKGKKKAGICYRCQDKKIVRAQFGQGVKIATTLYSSRPKSKGPKAHISCSVLWPLVSLEQQQEIFTVPEDIVLDGYTKDPWALYENNPEGVWSTALLWCGAGSKVTQLLEFLAEHRKCAYGTYILPCGTDGVFVIPFDQPPVPTSVSSDDNERAYVHCKYIVGLGLAQGVDDEDPSQRVATTNAAQEEDRDGKHDEDYATQGILGSLVSKVRKTDQSLTCMSQQEAREYLTRQARQQQEQMPGPLANTTHPATGDWFRPSSFTLEK